MGLCHGFIQETGSFVIAEQSLHTAKAFSAPHFTPSASKLEVHEELGGDTARTADPNDQRHVPDHLESCLT